MTLTEKRNETSKDQDKVEAPPMTGKNIQVSNGDTTQHSQVSHLTVEESSPKPNKEYRGEDGGQ